MGAMLPDRCTELQQTARAAPPVCTSRNLEQAAPGIWPGASLSIDSDTGQSCSFQSLYLVTTYSCRVHGCSVASSMVMPPLVTKSRDAAGRVVPGSQRPLLRHWQVLVSGAEADFVIPVADLFVFGAGDDADGFSGCRKARDHGEREDSNGYESAKRGHDEFLS
jgi:hypothetical protein